MRLPAIFLLGLCALPGQVRAQGTEISANIGLTSDYRFRGLSLSGRGPALQGGVDLESSTGLFAGAWGSTIAEYEGAEVELDLYAGYAGSAAGFDYRLSANAYFYPGARGVNYVEFRLEAERSMGPVTLGMEAAFVPRQSNIAVANHYLGASGAVALPGIAGVALNVRGGWEQGFYDSKWDWEAGLSYTRGVLTASLTYVDSNHGGPVEAGRLGRAGVVAALLASF